ncbi:hypothetical protein ACIBH1_12535 [Nonomuraea sp. NPDC050663]|uniref:Type II secretory pathway component PulJ n=1 Tax=Nonomuraea soli TaxID=1032476 RepID=A0A7W0CHC6_9ACTN|nr:hypothetical protein [Nonomuraea soli]MBA2891153.1 type II secretory pathway component PulJ [Nonomuraea soli]
MPSLAISTTGLILLTVLVTLAIIALILLAVRFVHHPRNSLTVSEHLMDQARELKAHGRMDDAVFLVRGEAGMSHRAAVRFVRRL